MKDLFIKIRGADIKEIEIFMLLVTVWVLVLFTTAFFFPAFSLVDSAVMILITKLPIISSFIYGFASLITILGIFTYLGKFAKFIGPWLLMSGVFWGGMSLLMLVFQPFTIIFGVCAFLTTTSFHLFTLQIRERHPRVMCRKYPQCRRKFD